tara:strand:+ start:36 stop:452 length:417 start_codon:yes stop_codon:yes gene_type:complete
MEKYLYFNNAGTDGQIDAADDVLCVPASRFRGFNQPGTTRTEITLYFAPVEGPIELGTNLASASVSDTVVLTITSDKHKEVIDAIISAIDAPVIAGSGKNVITIADDMNAKYLSVDPDSAGVAVAISGCVIVCQAPAA